MKYIAAAICALQGVLNAVCFIGAWTLNGTDAGFRSNPWIFSGNVFLGDPVGKLFGLMSLGALGAFIGAAVALVIDKPWWRAMVVLGASISLVTVLPWWNTWQPISLLAVLLIDVLAFASLAVQQGERVA